VVVVVMVVYGFAAAVPARNTFLQDWLCMLAPSEEPIGFLFALINGTRGTPLTTRGSFISVGSSFAGIRLITCL
jgi:hypothetical protein